MPRTAKSRPFLPWSKKRGQRIIGNSFRGLAGEALFYAGLFLLGVFGAALVMVGWLAPERSPEEAISVGLAAWIFGTLSLVLVAAGTGGLLYRLGQVGASSERRSAITARARARELIGWGTESGPPIPYVPQGRSLTDSPGERLTYRLPPANPPGGPLVGPAILSLLWNAVWFILLAVVISGFWIGHPRWILMGLLIPFGLIGIWSFRYFLRQLRQFAGVGATIVEIGEHPLVPGRPYRLYVAQMGRLRLKRLKISLVCEEETFFRQGTDVRVERCEALAIPIHRESDVRIDPRRPWEQQLRFELPDQAMHSFVGTHNAIRWKFVVNGEARPWPSFCRSFPVVVHPPGLPPKRSPR